MPALTARTPLVSLRTSVSFWFILRHAPVISAELLMAPVLAEAYRALLMVDRTQALLLAGTLRRAQVSAAELTTAADLVAHQEHRQDPA